ncbi:transposase [Streptomyces neyagawaensis]|uniref:Mutator family transposase n=1 Tax=Streptomyces neyagawaensis TaxID=42238 RepID=A0ABV3AVI3_9ACTN
MLSVVTDDGSTRSGSLIDEIVREGARRMLATALEAEVSQYIAELAAGTDERGHRLVVRNGHHRPLTVVTAAGPVEVRAPRVNDRRVDDETGERRRFSSKILAPWCRKSPKISEVLPLLYLHRLSAATVTRLTKQWSDDHAAFQDGDLSDRDVVYVWADGVHPEVRLRRAHSCVLVLLRTKVTRGAGSPAAALAMVFKLVESAQARWRAITGAHLVPLVRAGARFENGVLVEREGQAA